MSAVSPRRAGSPVAFFSESKVQSCSKVVMLGGRAVGIGYSSPNRSFLQPNQANKSAERRSISHDSYKVRPNLHVGMKRKPLEAYSPDAYRSRLPGEDFIQPYKNASSVVIGDRSSRYKRHFVTTAQNLFRPPVFEVRTNPGILSDQTKWTRHMELL